MSNEKMQILKMLESGKITAEEASRLLQAAGGDGRRTGTRTQRSNDSVVFDNFAGDLGRKFETLAKDMEPKIRDFVGVVADRTANLADKVSKNINEAERSREPEAQGRASAPSPSHNFELSVESGYNELNLEAYKGDISVTGYNGNKITVKVFAKELRPGARLELMRLGSRYYLSYDQDDFRSVSVDALVPEGLFDSVIIRTVDGHMEVSNISSEFFTAEGGASRFKNIRAANIKIDSVNGRILLDGISAENAHIEGANGALDANYIDVANLRLLTSNGAITMNSGDYKYKDYTWIVETSNGKVTMNVPSSPRIGYHIKANTSLGNIRLGLNLNYITNTPSCVEAKSANFDTGSPRVRISAETSNSTLSIN